MLHSKVTAWFWDGSGHLHKVTTTLGWVLHHVDSVASVESITIKI